MGWGRCGCRKGGEPGIPSAAGRVRATKPLGRYSFAFSSVVRSSRNLGFSKGVWGEGRSGAGFLLRHPGGGVGTRPPRIGDGVSGQGFF